MNDSRRQSAPLTAVCIATALLPFALAKAGEVAVDPSDDGTDILEDTTFDQDSRSSEVAAAAEHFIEPPPSQEMTVPLAEAVAAAVGLPEPLVFLGNEIMPATAERLSWSATELFEGVPVSTPVLVVSPALR